MERAENPIIEERLNSIPGILIILTGPTASGKTLIKERLIEKYTGLEMLVTTTSRHPRTEPGKRSEIDGVDYHFVSEERFKEMIINGDFVEYVIYPAGEGNKKEDQFYGTTKDEVNKLFQGKSLISSMDISGAANFQENVRKAFSENIADSILGRVTVINIQTESEEVQRRWYEKRGEGLDKLEDRMKKDKESEAIFGHLLTTRVVNFEGRINDTLFQVEGSITDKFGSPLDLLFPKS